jgi:hypothetical protein
VWTGLSGPGYRLVVGSCEHGNKHSVPQKTGNLTIWVTISYSRTLLHGVIFNVKFISRLISVIY